MKAKNVLFTLALFLSYIHLSLAQWTAFNPGASPNNFMMSIAAVDMNIVWGVPMPSNFTATKEFLKTTDGGQTWTVSQISEASPDYYTLHIFALDENTAWVTRLNLPAQDKTEILKTTDGGASWVQQTIPNTADFTACVAIHFFNENEGTSFAETYDGSNWAIEAYFTEDGGNSWQLADSPALTGDRIFLLVGNNHYEVIGNTLWFGTSQGRIFRSTDKGKTWEAFETGLVNRTIHSLSFKDALHGMAVSIWDSPATSYLPNLAIRTSDGGKTWTQSSIPNSPQAVSIEHLPGSNGVYIMAGVSWSTAGAAISPDNGNHWKTISNDLLNCVQFLSPGIGWAGGQIVGGTAPAMFKWTGGEQLFDENLINVRTPIGSGIEGFQDGDAAKAKFWNPKGMAMDRAGNLYVADDYNSSIRKITPDGEVTTLAGTGERGYANGPGGQAQFSRPQDVVFDSEGNLFVADATNFVIRKITPDGTVSLYAGKPGVEGNEDGPALEATFGWCPALGIDAFDNLYVAAGNYIRRIDAQGMVSTLYTSGVVWGLDADADGNVYYARFHTNFIYKLSTEGVLETLAGGTGCADGSFSFPEDVAVDGYGNVYVADGTNRRVRKIDPQGNVTTLAGDGCINGVATEYHLVDGAGESAQFGRLRSVFLKPDGNLLVTSWDNDAVREVEIGAEPSPLVVLESNTNVPYRTMPIHQLQPISFNGAVLNTGENDMEKVRLNVKVEKEGSSVFNKNSPLITLPANGLEVLEPELTFLPAEPGVYEVTFQYRIGNFQQTFFTGHDEFIVSDSVMAVDDGHQYLADGPSAENGFASYGQVYELTQGDTLQGFSFNGSADSATFFFRVFDAESGAPGTVVFTSDTVSQFSVSSSADAYLPLSEPVYLPPGKYMMALERTDPAGTFRLGVDADRQDHSAWHLSPSQGVNTWSPYFQFWNQPDGPVFMLRPVFRPPLMTAVQEQEALPFTLDVFPNPAAEVMSILVKGETGEVFQARLFDLTGRLVQTLETQGGTTATLNLKDVSPGAYFVKVFNEKGTIALKFIKE